MDNELFEKAPIPEAYFSLAMPVVLTHPEEPASQQDPVH